MSLWQDSGGDATSRRTEATKLINQIQDAAAGFLTAKEEDFVSQLENEKVSVSPKQLFWLRDIKDKYI